MNKVDSANKAEWWKGYYGEHCYIFISFTISFQQKYDINTISGYNITFIYYHI